MIPLRSTDAVLRFPMAVVFLLLIYASAHVLTFLWPGSRHDFLLEVAFSPSVDPWRQIWGAVLFFPHTWAFLVHVIFAWAFLPTLIQARGIFLVALGALGSYFLAVWFFSALHPSLTVPLLAADTVLAGCLGMYLRRDPWSTVDTVVPGPGWIRIFEVPAYVLFFFYVFYQLLSNLFLSEPFASAPMLYFMTMAAFLCGFIYETILVLIGIEKKTPHAA